MVTTYVACGNWAADTLLTQIKKDFEIQDTELDGVTILYAGYWQECYEGSAFVLFEKGGKLYEVNGSHCSCRGLEGQWEPAETDYASLSIRPYVHYEASATDNEAFVKLVKEKL